jgi:peptidoglycan/xylan/chitin deacetylase (PgdA/CDA1 family)
MRGTWRLRRWARQIAPKAIILLYHRVAEVPTDPQLLCVSPKHFAEHLQVLKQNCHLLSLSSLRRRLALNLWPPRSVVVTFDDGYADNLHQARPLLEAADVPATAFVTASQVDSQREFWWDELERVLLSLPTLPEILTLTLNGQEYRWTIQRNDGGGRPDTGWHVLMDSEPTPRQVVYLELDALLRDLDHDVRAQALVQLLAWAGLQAEGRPDHRALTSDELQALARGGLVEIGAHTVTHPVLSALPIQAQREEIVAGKRRLEEVVGQPVTSFSYPFGGRPHYSADTIRLVKEAGFDCACSNFPGHVQWKTDPYQLPRFLVRDWDGDEFARRLEGWFDG